MVLALLATLLVVTLSGLKVYAIEEGQGPFASSSANLAPVGLAHAEEEQNDSDDEADEEFWEEIHEASSNFMLLLIAVHVLGVVIAGRVHKENLVKAMFTGKKHLP